MISAKTINDIDVLFQAFIAEQDDFNEEYYTSERSMASEIWDRFKQWLLSKESQ
jgi:hypothetical protein